MRALLQFYRYVFYWSYSWALRTYGPAHSPDITGLGAVVIPSYCNLLASTLAVVWLTRHKASTLLSLQSWQVGLVGLLVLLPQYLYLVHKGRYRRIAAGFDGWPQARRRRYGRWAWVYVLGSVGSLVLAAYVGKNFPLYSH